MLLLINLQLFVSIELSKIIIVQSSKIQPLKTVFGIRANVILINASSLYSMHAYMHSWYLNISGVKIMYKWILTNESEIALSELNNLHKKLYRCQFCDHELQLMSNICIIKDYLTFPDELILPVEYLYKFTYKCPSCDATSQFKKPLKLQYKG